MSHSNHEFGARVSVGRNVFSWRPKVSVVIPAYNVAEFIGEAIESAIGQKYRDHEIIVVNDGSPDTQKLERALHQYWQDIVYIKQPCLGAGAARNTAIIHARSDIIAFLDGDDIWLPDFLTSQLAFLSQGYDMVYCDAQQFGMRSVLRRSFMEQAPSNGEVTVASLLEYRCNVITSGTVAKKASLVRAGLFEHERTKAHDFHLWVRMAKTGAKIGYQQKQLLKYRVHLNSLSGDSIERVDREIDVLNRIKNGIELDADESAIVERQLAGLTADLQIEYGKAFLLKEEFQNAYQAFAEANRQRRSAKMTAIMWLARVAPRRLLKHYKNHRADEIAFVMPKAANRAFPSK